jgi:hypothetical protein
VASFGTFLVSFCFSLPVQEMIACAVLIFSELVLNGDPPLFLGLGANSGTDGTPGRVMERRGSETKMQE